MARNTIGDQQRHDGADAHRGNEHQRRTQRPTADNRQGASSKQAFEQKPSTVKQDDDDRS